MRTTPLCLGKEPTGVRGTAKKSAKEKKLNDNWKTEQGRVAMTVVSQHLNKLECYACPATWAPQCYGCHFKYDRRASGVNWVLTGINHDLKTGP